MAVSDYGDVGCARFREALSARLDGEPEPVDPTQVDTHLANCGGCRQWLDDAAKVTRLARTGPVTAGGIDVTAAVLPSAPGQWRSRLLVGLRLLLAVFGTVQVILGVVQATTLRPEQEVHVHGTTVDGATAGHLWHETAAWNIAIGAAFLWIASRRGRPAGIVPILGVFIGVLALFSATDVVAGRVEMARLASHGFVVFGYVVVLALARPWAQLEPPGGGRWRTRHAASALTGDLLEDPADDPPDQSGGRVIRFPNRSQPAADWPHREAA